MSRGGINKLAEGPLGETLRVYQIDSSGIEKLTRIKDVTKVTNLQFTEFPILIDDDLTLLIDAVSVGRGMPPLRYGRKFRDEPLVINKSEFGSP